MNFDPTSAFPIVGNAGSASSEASTAATHSSTQPTFDPDSAQPVALLEPTAETAMATSGAKPSTGLTGFLKDQLGATGDTPYGTGGGYLIDNPATRGLGSAANKLGTGVAEVVQHGAALVNPDAGAWLQRNVTTPLVDRQAQLSAPKDAGVGSAAVQMGADLAGQLAFAGLTGGTAEVPVATKVATGLVGKVAPYLTPAALRAAGLLGVGNAGSRVAQEEAQTGKPVSDLNLIGRAAIDTAANLVPLGGAGGIGKRAVRGALVGEGINEVQNVVDGQPIGTGALPAVALGAGLATLPHAPHASPEPAGEGIVNVRTPTATPYPEAAPGSLSEAANMLVEPTGPLGRAAQAAQMDVPRPNEAGVTAAGAPPVPDAEGQRAPAPAGAVSPDQPSAPNVVEQTPALVSAKDEWDATVRAAVEHGEDPVELATQIAAKHGVSADDLLNTPDVSPTPVEAHQDQAQAPAAMPSEGSTTASIPFMITQAMKRDLRAAGHSDADIARMTPEQAHAALNEPSGNTEQLPADAADGNERAPGAEVAAPATAGAEAAGQANAGPAAIADGGAAGTAPDLGTAVSDTVAGATNDTNAAVAQSTPTGKAEPAGEVSASESPTNPVHAALRSMAVGEHPDKVLQGADEATVRGVAKAMGRKFSPKAPVGAMVERMGEEAASDRTKKAAAAVKQLAPDSTPTPHKVSAAAMAAEGVRVKTPDGEVNGRMRVDRLLAKGFTKVESVPAGNRMRHQMVRSNGAFQPIPAAALAYAKEAAARHAELVSTAAVPPAIPANATDRLSVADSHKLQEAHRALGMGVTRGQVQKLRDRVARTVEAGTENIGGITVKLRPKALQARRETLARLDHDLALFDAAKSPKVEAAAMESAAHPNNEKPDPTPAQQEVGNHSMGHVRLHGLDVSIEIPKGGTRRGIDAKGKPWERVLSEHYGRILRTVGGDGEQVDVYLGPHAEDASKPVFVIDQVKPGTKVYDESKVMLGYATGAEARKAYDSNFPKDVKTFGGIRKMSLDEFKTWLKEGDTTKPAATAQPVVNQQVTTEPSEPSDVPVKTAKPRLAESAGDLWTAIKTLSATGVLEKSTGRILYPQLRVVAGDTYIADGNGELSILDSKTGGIGVKAATAKQADAFHHDLAADRVEVVLTSAPGFGSAYGRQHVLQVLHSPSGNDFAGRRGVSSAATAEKSSVVAPTATPAAVQPPVAVATKPAKRGGIATNGAKVRVAGGKLQYVPRARETIEAYFKPGDVVPSYGGQDRVISTDFSDQGNPLVRVVAVDKDGNAKPNERERVHGTMPSERELVAKLGKPMLAEKAAPPYRSEQKSHERLQSVGLQLPGEEAARGRGRKVVTDSDPVKVIPGQSFNRDGQINTPAFRRWFGESKVADTTGTPMPVFHGTAEEFPVFNDKDASATTGHDTAALGHFFTPDRKLAEGYADKASQGRPADQRVVDAYLSIQKPYVMSMDEAHAIDSPERAKALRARLEAQSYDGIHMPESNTWIAFKSEQIKSASENRGTFDPSNPNIYFSRGSVVDADPSAKGLPVENVQRIAKEFIARYKGNIPLDVRVGKTLDDIYGPGSEAKLGKVAGAYHPARGVFTLAADRLQDRAGVETTLRHEILGHYGLNTLEAVDKRAVLDAILASRDVPSLRETWAKVDQSYADKSADARAEEVFAALAEKDPSTLGAAWDKVLATIQKGLRAVGLLRGQTSRAELQDLARRIGRGIRNGERVQRTFPQSDDAQFQRQQAPTARLSREEAPEHLTEDQRQALRKMGAFAQGDSLATKAKRLTDRWREKVVQGVVDQFAPFKALDHEAYMQARLSRGTDGALEATFLHGTPKLTDGALDVNVDGKGLRGVLADLKGEHDLFLAWVAGNRSAELKAEGREHLFSDADIHALQGLNQGTMPDGRSRPAAYRQALGEFQRYQRAVLDIGEHAGLFSESGRAHWASEFYIPFFRNMSGEPAARGAPGSDTGNGSNFSESGTEDVVKPLKGGAQPLGDLLSNTLENWSSILTASMRNMAASKALHAAERMGIAEKVETAQKQSVRVMRAGEPVHYVVHDPLVLDAMTMLNFNGESNKATRVLSTFKRALSFGVTVSPGFRIRNLLRDSVSALATSDVGYNPLRNILDGWRATGSENATFHKLLAGGGAVRFGALNDGEQATHAKRLIAMGVKDTAILDTPTKVKNALGAAWEWWKEIGDRGETVNRAVIYERARANGSSHLEASYQARDLLDFTMGGKWAAVQFLAHTVPFLNARMQGLYRLGRGAQENPLRFAAVTGAIALASAANYLLQKDDPDFRALPDWARDTYWCVKLGDHMLFLPKPFEIGALGTVIERGTELATAGDDYQTRDFARTLVRVAADQLSMNPIPQAVKPLTEAFFNYDMYQGRPIDSQGQQELPPADRYTARTSTPAVLAGGALHVSPQRIDHMVRGYFGWLGLQALNVADMLGRPLTSLPSNPTRDVYAPTNWPVVGEFLRSPSSISSKYVDRFYTSQQQANQVYAAYSLARRTGDFERARELAGTDAVRLRKLHNLQQRQMQEVNQRIRRTTSDRSLNPTEKRPLLDALYEQRNRIAQRADARLRARAQ